MTLHYKFNVFITKKYVYVYIKFNEICIFHENL